MTGACSSQCVSTALTRQHLPLRRGGRRQGLFVNPNHRGGEARLSCGVRAGHHRLTPFLRGPILKGGRALWHWSLGLGRPAAVVGGEGIENSGERSRLM